MYGLQLSKLLAYLNTFIISWKQGVSDNWGSTVQEPTIYCPIHGKHNGTDCISVQWLHLYVTAILWVHVHVHECHLYV